MAFGGLSAWPYTHVTLMYIHIYIHKYVYICYVNETKTHVELLLVDAVHVPDVAQPVLQQAVVLSYCKLDSRLSLVGLVDLYAMG